MGIHAVRAAADHSGRSDRFRSVSASHAKGHIATAYVADQPLMPTAQTRVQQLLQHNPAFDDSNNRLAAH